MEGRLGDGREEGGGQVHRGQLGGHRAGGRGPGGARGTRRGTAEWSQGEGVQVVFEGAEGVVEHGEARVEAVRGLLGEAVPHVVRLHAVSVGLQLCGQAEAGQRGAATLVPGAQREPGQHGGSHWGGEQCRQ